MNRKPTNNKNLAASSKLNMNLIPSSVLIEMALGMTGGLVKYGGYNYMVAGVDVQTYIAAAKRHIELFMLGEFRDEDDVAHLAAAMNSLGIVLDAFLNDSVIDNRPPPSPGSLTQLKMAGLRVQHLQDKYLGADITHYTIEDKRYAAGETHYTIEDKHYAAGE